MTDRTMTPEEKRVSQVQIANQCPACHGHTLFIGKGGWITCSLIGCKNPSLDAGLAAAVKAAEERGRNAEPDFCERCEKEKPAAYLCDTCVPIAIESYEKAQKQAEERMRERCARLADATYTTMPLAREIRALPLTGDSDD